MILPACSGPSLFYEGNWGMSRVLDIWSGVVTDELEKFGKGLGSTTLCAFGCAAPT
jgi:hypothetical protein